jgi:hypothetical protein
MESLTDARPAPAGDVRAATRAGTLVLVGLSLANGIFLYLFPSQAELRYAWPIAPSISAAVMGAGYLAGCIGASMALFEASRFRSFRAFLPGFVVLSLTMLAATIAHADRFRWDYAPTIGWTVVYAAVPIGVAVLWWRQEHDGGPRAGRDPRYGPVASASLVLAVVLAAVGAVLIVAPSSVLDDWPWQITPLLSRVFGGWYLFSAATLAFAALTVRQLHEVPIPYLTVSAWSVFLLPLPAVYSGSVEGGAALAAYLVLHALVALTCAAAVTLAWRAMRADAATL